MDSLRSASKPWAHLQSGLSLKGNIENSEKSGPQQRNQFIPNRNPNLANQSFNVSFELNTPIKRIQHLTLNSPSMNTSIYPNLDDITSGPSSNGMENMSVLSTSTTLPSAIEEDEHKENLNSFNELSMTSNMLNKGYSKKLTTNVLDELNLRANEISQLTKSPPPQKAEVIRNKRYSGAHRAKFNSMEPISQHFSVKSNDMDLDTPLTEENLNVASRLVPSEILRNRLSPTKEVSPSKENSQLTSPSKSYSNSPRDYLTSPSKGYSNSPKDYLHSPTKNFSKIQEPTYQRAAFKDCSKLSSPSKFDPKSKTPSNEYFVPKESPSKFLSSLQSPSKLVYSPSKHNLSSKVPNLAPSQTSQIPRVSPKDASPPTPEDTSMEDNSISKRASTILLSSDSHSKRRRTLNGPDEMLKYQSSHSSLSYQSPSHNPPSHNGSASPTNSSPIRKLSPLKNFMDLNLILKNDETPPFVASPIQEKLFAKPFPRMTSLEMAGVKGNSYIPSLQYKSLTHQLQKKSLIPHLQNKSLIPHLQNKSLYTNLNALYSNINSLYSSGNTLFSASNLQKKPLVPHFQIPLEHKPVMARKTLTPILRKKTSSVNLTSSTSDSSASHSYPSGSPSYAFPTSSSNSRLNKKSESSHSLYKGQSSSSKSIKSGLVGSSSTKSLSLNSSTGTGKNYTTPQPFSLYDKPTISSSQKSINKHTRREK